MTQISRPQWPPAGLQTVSALVEDDVLEQLRELAMRRGLLLQEVVSELLRTHPAIGSAGRTPAFQAFSQAGSVLRAHARQQRAEPMDAFVDLVIGNVYPEAP